MLQLYFITLPLTWSINAVICLYRLQYFTFHKVQTPGRLVVLQQDHIDCNRHGAARIPKTHKHDHHHHPDPIFSPDGPNSP